MELTQDEIYKRISETLTRRAEIEDRLSIPWLNDIEKTMLDSDLMFIRVLLKDYNRRLREILKPEITKNSHKCISVEFVVKSLQQKFIETLEPENIIHGTQLTVDLMEIINNRFVEIGLNLTIIKAVEHHDSPRKIMLQLKVADNNADKIFRLISENRRYNRLGAPDKDNALFISKCELTSVQNFEVFNYQVDFMYPQIDCLALEPQSKKSKHPTKTILMVKLKSNITPLVKAKFLVFKFVALLETFGLSALPIKLSTGKTRFNYIGLTFSDPWLCQKTHDLISELFSGDTVHDNLSLTMMAYMNSCDYPSIIKCFTAEN